MRSERIVTLLLLAIPLVVAFVGWPAIVRWATESPAPQPAATPLAEAQLSRPAPRTTELPATLAPRPANGRPAPTAPPTDAAVAEAEPTQVVPQAERIESSNDPSAAVTTFYGLIAQGQYDAAAQLWSPRMRTSFPPSQNINQRFSETRALTVRRADVISQDSQNGNAAVAVDVLESRRDGTQHWVGTWYLVRGPNGWLLDQPQLSGV